MKTIDSKIHSICYWSILILFGIVNLSCSDNDTPPATSEDVYYVQYQIQSQTIYTTTRIATFTIEDNTSSTVHFNTPNRETIIGPVKKGFNANLKGSYDTQGLAQTYIDAYIYVSKNNGPFALKKFDESSSVRYSVQINYTVDF